MWCDYLRCLYLFLKVEVDLCFKFNLREVLDINDFLKETTSALRLRFDCTQSVDNFVAQNVKTKYFRIIPKRRVLFDRKPLK